VTVLVNHDRRLALVRDDVVLRFIASRLSAEEALAKRVRGNLSASRVKALEIIKPGLDERWLAVNPQRVLDDIAATRALVEAITRSPLAGHPQMDGLSPWAINMLKHVAARWSRHPDFPNALR
jgi:hypothetical protein